MTTPQQYVVLRPSLQHLHCWRFVRNVWWSGRQSDLWGIVCRQDKTLWVFPVDEADRMCPDIGSFEEERKQR